MVLRHFVLASTLSASILPLMPARADAVSYSTFNVETKSSRDEFLERRCGSGGVGGDCTKENEQKDDNFRGSGR